MRAVTRNIAKLRPRIVNRVNLSGFRQCKHKRAAVVRVTGTTGASTITAITGGDPGRVVEIKSDVAGVTMVHGASLRLKNAANYVFGAGTTIALRCALDGTWDEMWRE